MRIALWSGPRNLSTAMMYSFAARGDCAVWDEPFYAAYLKATGIAHPMADQVIAAGIADPACVAAACTGAIPDGKPLFYQKHMTLHMVAGFDRNFMAGLTNVFPDPTPGPRGCQLFEKARSSDPCRYRFSQQAKLFDQVADRLGEVPLVVDSADIRATPRETLGRCAQLERSPLPKGCCAGPPVPNPMTRRLGTALVQCRACLDRI